MPHSSRWPRRVLAVAIALSTPAGQHLTAVAGPDDQKIVMSEGHVDSPKAFWDKGQNNFTLKSSYGDTSPVDETVSWLPHYYLQRGRNKSEQQQFIRLVTDEPGEEILGKPGQPLFWAQAVPADLKNMLWQGFGADTNIPVERFRDGSFQLDLVDFQGPGDMTFSRGGEGFPVANLLSSVRKANRSIWLTAGDHSHNDTTFTKPGRYVMKMSASARGKDGKLIQSPAQTVTWQVGGTKPSSKNIGDVKKAFDAAASHGSQTATGAKLSIAPAQREHMSTLTFATGNAGDNGTAVFYIDGHYLAEVPVKAGMAEWEEMLGAGTSSYQVVYVPSAQSVSKPWVSAPLSYDAMGAATTGETTKAGTFPTAPTRPASPTLARNDYRPTSNDVHISNKQGSAFDEFDSLTVKPKDDSLSLHVVGGLYRPGSHAPSCEVDFVSTPADRTGEYDADCAGKDLEWRLTVVPQSWVKPGATTVKVDSKANAPYALNGTAQLGNAQSAAPSAPAEEPKAEDSAAVPNKTPVTLSQGHVDIAPALTKDGLRVTIGDDTRQHSTTSVVRDPKAVTLEVREQARKVRKGKATEGSAWDFLGKPGEQYWLLPESQNKYLVWPGFSTEHLDRSTFPKGVDFEIAPGTSPAGAQWFAFKTSSLDRTPHFIADNTKTFTYPDPGHSHINWVFTAPGKYTVKVRAVPKAGSPAELSQPTPWEFITFDVKGTKGSADNDNNDNNGNNGDNGNSNNPKPPAQPSGSSQVPSWGWVLIALGALGGLGLALWPMISKFIR